MKRKENGRIAFTPSAKSREYFDELSKRLTRERMRGVHATQSEAFDFLISLAQVGETYLSEKRREQDIAVGKK